MIYLCPLFFFMCLRYC